MDTATAKARARSLWAQAREHKRVSNSERKRAKAKMEELREFCSEHGIDFVLERNGQQRPGQVSHLPGSRPTLRVATDNTEPWRPSDSQDPSSA